MNEKPLHVFSPVIHDDSIKRVTDVLRSGWLGLGPVTKEFEAAFADYIGVKPEQCVAMNSCTAALHTAVVLARIGHDDVVLTTANTFVSTNHAIIYERGEPRFCDIEDDGNISTMAMSDWRKRSRVVAAVMVHFGGYPCNLTMAESLCKETGWKLIEDCAHACGSTYMGQSVGTFGDYGCFSFHAVKNLPAGDGGMLVCKSLEDADKARMLRWLGIDKGTYERTETMEDRGAYAWEYSVPLVGFKYHMNDITAAIALEELKRVEANNQRRRDIATAYENALRECPGIRVPGYMASDLVRKTSAHFYPILVDNRAALIEKLKAHNIHPGMHYVGNDQYYPWLCKQDLPNTRFWTEHELTLPIHMNLTDEDVERIIGVVLSGW